MKNRRPPEGEQQKTFCEHYAADPSRGMESGSGADEKLLITPRPTEAK